MKNWFSSNKKWVLLTLALVVIIAVAGMVYAANRPAVTAGAKNIAIEVVSADQSSASFQIATQSEYLRGALEEIELVKGDESAYGLFIKTVNGYTADDSKQEWWCVTKGGENVMTGVDSTPIANGDAFELTLKTGY